MAIFKLLRFKQRERKGPMVKSQLSNQFRSEITHEQEVSLSGKSVTWATIHEIRRNLEGQLAIDTQRNKPTSESSTPKDSRR